MKLLFVAMCMAIGPELFIRCQNGDVEYFEDFNVNDGDALMEKIGQIKDDLEERATDDYDRRNGSKALLIDDTDEGFDDMDVKGLSMKRNIVKNKNILKFGDKGQYIAGKNSVIGKGDDGKVYEALDTTTGQKVAVKTESTNAKNPSLLTESKNYAIIGRHNGILRIYYSGISCSGDEISQVLVMQLLRNSLADLQKDRKKKRFSPKTVYMIGIQLMYRIETIHNKHLVHRDIKPGNMGIGKSGELIYIFDFGQSRKYVDGYGRHLPEGRRSEYGVGDMRYMSVYAHKHKRVSRRDDLWSIGFVMMSFLRGDLPWYKARGYNKPASKSQVVRMKEKLNFDAFCIGAARRMAQYFKYLRNNLKFSTKPNYAYLRKLFRAALSDIGEKEDYKFDWLTKGNY